MPYPNPDGINIIRVNEAAYLRGVIMLRSGMNPQIGFEDHRFVYVGHIVAPHPELRSFSFVVDQIVPK